MQSGRKMETEKSTWLDADALRRVAIAIGGQSPGNALEECKISDVKHVVELLARIMVLEDVAPGFVASMLDTFIPHYLEEAKKQELAEEAQREADTKGYGAEWKAAVEAGRSPKKKAFIPAMVRMAQAAHKISEEEAILRVANHYGIDLESVQRAMRRHRKNG